MKKFKSAFSIFLSFSIMLSGFRLAAQEEQSNEDVFAALMQSMGSVAEEESAPKTETDKAIADAFGGIDEVIEKSAVPIDVITPEKVIQAKKIIAATPVSSNIETEFVKQGVPMSMMIWGDAKNSIGKEITNIIKRLYQTNDSMNFRIIVNSDPVPWMSAKSVDLNQERRAEEQAIFEREQARYERQDKSLPTNIVRPSAPFIPQKPGSTIEISAGLLATIKNTDELAARVAFELAKLNPKVYGVPEDSRFTSRADVIALINQLVENSGNEDSKKIRKTRDEIIAEFSAIERLAAAEFNPWALYKYEKDTFGWMADKFLKSGNHYIARKLTGNSKYKLDDWSRPIRLLLQSNYMAHLQSVERGRGMKLDDTALPKSLKRLRFRMRMYTEPFYMGTAAQSAVLLGGTLGVVHYYFPEVAHWAMSAVHLSGPVTDVATVQTVQETAQAIKATADVVQEAAKEAVNTEPGAIDKVGATVGEYVTKVKNFSHETLENASITYNHVSEKVTVDAVTSFFSEYRMALGATAVAMTGVVLAKNSKFLGEMMHSISRSKELDRIEREKRRQEQASAQEELDRTRKAETPVDPVKQEVPRRDLYQDIANVAPRIEQVVKEKTQAAEERVQGINFYQRGVNWITGTSDTLKYGFAFVVLTPGKIKASSQKKMHEYIVNGREYTRRSQLAYQNWIEERKEQSVIRAEQAEISKKEKEAAAAQKKIDDKVKAEEDAVAKAKKIVDDKAKAEAKILADLNRRVEKRAAKAKRDKEIADQRAIDKEKNRLARIEASKKRKEIYRKLGEDSLEAWETLDRVMTALPGKTKNSVVMGLKFGANRGNTFLFEYIPEKGQATRDGIVNATHVAAEGLREFKREHDERSQQKKQAALRLQQAIYKREAISQDDSLTPREIERIMENIFKSYTDKNVEFMYSEWGINFNKFDDKKRSKLYFNLFERWIYQAEIHGVDDYGLGNMAKFIEKIWASSPNAVLSEREIAIGVKFLRMMMANGGPETQRYIKAIEARSDLAVPNMHGNETIAKYRATVGVNYSEDRIEYYNNFLTMINSHRLIADKAAGVTGDQHVGKAALDALRSARSSETKAVAKKFYDKDEKEVIAWLTRPETPESDVRKFLLAMVDQYDAKWSYPYSHLSLGTALKEIHPLGAIKFLQAAKPKRGGNADMFEASFSKFNNQMSSFLDSRLDAAMKGWMDRAQSMTDLVKIVEEETKSYGIDKNLFKTRFYQQLKSRSDLIKSLADYKVFYEKDYFWAAATGQEKVTPLERPLQALLELKRKQFQNSPIWMYDPILSEQIQSVTMRKLIEIDGYPKTYNEVVDLWTEMTSRGVSTVTDDMLAGLMKTGTPEQIDHLESLAVQEGRLFDQVARDEFAVRQIKRLSEYGELMNSLSQSNEVRLAALNRLLYRSQTLMSEMGIRYSEFLEELSVEINSNFEEARILDDAKKNRIVNTARGATSAEVKDSRIAMFEQMLDHVKGWKAKNQYEFLLYLRGNIEATDFIKAQFPKFGPERIRKIYQSLPIETAMGVASLYLEVTFLARKDVDEGYGKKLTEYIVSQGANDDGTKKYANLLLKGLLKGLDVSKNPPFKMKVVSALVAMKPAHMKGAAVDLNQHDSQVSVGETIKVILEKFPGVGPKIGQFLVGTNRLPKDINDVLTGTQDQSLPPTRFQMFSDIADIVGKGANIGIELGDLLGAGSLKYSVLGKFNGKPVALQIFREDVQNNVDFQIAALHGMIDDVIEKGGKDWAFLRVIVDGAVNAVYREKDFTQEAHKTKIAREQLYAHFNDDTFTVAVPKQQQLNKRLLVSDYAEGISFKDKSFPQEDKLPVAIKLLEMEAKVLYGQSSGVITYDTDRHAGNYLIDIKNEGGKKKYKISPIDFGQLTTITVEQRERVERVFSYAALLGKFGQNEWLIDQIAKEFGMKDKNRDRLAKSIMETFPLKGASGGGEAAEGADGKIITDYFSLIGAINETFRDTKKGGLHADVNLASLDPDLRSGKLDFAYTDFVRAIIQLNQYEDVVAVPKHVMTPSKILSERVKDKVAKHLEKMELSRWQGLWVFKTNAERWIKAKVKGEKFEEFNFRLSREQLDAIDIIGGKGAKAEPSAAYLRATAAPLSACGNFYKATSARK